MVETVNNVHCINNIANVKENEPLTIDLVVNGQLMTFDTVVKFFDSFRQTKYSWKHISIKLINEGFS